MIDSLIGGGAETTNLRLANVFLEKGYNVHLILMRNTIDFEIDKRINLVFLDFKKNKISLLNEISYAKKLNKLLLEIEKKYGSINLKLGSLGLTHKLMNIINDDSFYYVLHGSTTKAKINQRSGLKKLIKTYKLKKLYDKKNIICVSNGVKEDILQLNITPLWINTIYNFFDFEEIKSLSKEAMPLNVPKNYIVHVGRFAKVKRHDILIKAFSLLKDKSLNLILVGAGVEKENSEKLVEELNLSNRVIFAGFQKNPYPLIKNAKALVLSSDNEGFGNVLVEALTLNTMAISTNCPYGPKEILPKQYLSKVSDYKDLAKVIEQNLENPLALENNFIAKFGKDTIIKNYEQLLS